MKNLTLLFACLFVITTYAQTPKTITLEKPYFDRLEKNEITIKDSTYLYIGDGEATDLFYYALVPEKKIKGLLILMPPTGQSVEVVINHNIELSKLAYNNGMLLVVPSMNYNLCLEEKAMRFLNATFNDVLEKYNPPKDKIIMGGFSLGGMNAIRYTQMAYQNTASTVIRPLAVYGVDPPLDWTRIYYSFERTMEKNFSEPAMQEAKAYLNNLNIRFEGTPTDNPKNYIKYSMYSRGQKEGGNTRYLKEVPIRIYSDPDIDWHLKNRHTDYYDMNALDQTAMINQLQLLGNEKAEYINALGKGYRLDGKRHPHSWSIAEPKEGMEWMLNLLENFKMPELPTDIKSDETTVEIKPILIDKATLSGIDLMAVRNPSDPDRRLFQKRLFRGKDISVYVVSSETATATWDSYGIEEFIAVVNGRARLNPKNGEEQFFNHGDFFVAPRGYSGDWETQGAEEFYHELSVIANSRPDTITDLDSNKTLPHLIDRTKLSGIGMTKVNSDDGKEQCRDVLYEGLELKVISYAEAAGIKEITTPLQEQLIYVISGTLTITAANSEEQTFYSGDYFVLPDGFLGTWESRGHGLVRWVGVEKNMHIRG